MLSFRIIGMLSFYWTLYTGGINLTIYVGDGGGCSDMLKVDGKTTFTNKKTSIFYFEVSVLILFNIFSIPHHESKAHFFLFGFL